MSSDQVLHITWDSLHQHLQQRAQLEAQVMAGFQPKPWRVPTDEEMSNEETIDWCATP